MCTNGRWIHNHYTHKKVFVKCGKCKACLQEKACARANRMRHDVKVGCIQFFCTFTYAPAFVPYILRDELKGDSLDINIYRDCSVRWYKGKQILNHGTRIIDSTFVDVPFRSESEIGKLKDLVGSRKGCIGVCYNLDFQNFIKRLRIYLERHGYTNEWSYFYCSEYGSHTYRPHFHATFQCPKDDEIFFRNAIIKNWPYADMHRTEKYVEIARDASTYCSSYVNSPTGTLPLFTLPIFRQKHRYSVGFGLGLGVFSLNSILEKVREGSLHYNVARKFDGNSAVSPVPIPKYVISRFFPIEGGFSALPIHALEQLLLSPSAKCWEFLAKRSPYKLIHEVYNFSDKQTYQFAVHLENAYQRYYNITGRNRWDYAIDYIAAWRCYYSTCERLLHESYEGDYTDFYCNNLDVIEDGTLSSYLAEKANTLVVDPNTFKDVVLTTSNFLSLYEKLDKTRKVNNYCMSKFDNCI